MINDYFEQPFYQINVFGELLEPAIKFDPEVLILRPVPLGVKLSEHFFIKPIGYEKYNQKLKLHKSYKSNLFKFI